MPTVCSETCVGRLRYIGLMLYDADRVLGRGVDERTTRPLRRAAGGVPRPARPGGGRRRPSEAGIPDDWIDGGAAVAGLGPDQAVRGRAAAAPGVPDDADGLVHPAAVAGGRRRCARPATTREDAGNLFGAIDALRIPVEYLAELFTAGDPAPVHGVLRRLAAMRVVPCATDQPRPRDARRVHRRGGRDDRRGRSTTCTGCSPSPSTRSATSSPPRTPSRRTQLEELATECSLDYEGGPGMGGSGPFGEASGRPVTPVAVENFHVLSDRQTADEVDRPGDQPAGSTCSTGTARAAPRACSRPPAAASADRRRRPGHLVSGRPRGRWPRRAGVAAAALSRRRASGATCPTLRTAVDGLPAAVGGPLRQVARPPRAHRPTTSCVADVRATFDLRRRCCLHLTYYTHGDTRKRGLALVRFKQAYRRRPGSTTRRTASCPTTCAPCWTSPPVDAGRWHAAAAGAPRRARPARGEALGRDAGSPYAARGRGGPRTLPPPRPARCAPPWPGLAADRAAGARRSDSTRSDSSDSDAEPVDDTRSTSCCGSSSPTCALAVFVGGPRLALPLRQVRLDHPLVAALRAPPAALGQPAVPLRHPAGPRRPRRAACCIPKSLDRGRRRHRGTPTT